MTQEEKRAVERYHELRDMAENMFYTLWLLGFGGYDHYMTDFIENWGTNDDGSLK